MSKQVINRGFFLFRGTLGVRSWGRQAPRSGEATPGAGRVRGAGPPSELQQYGPAQVVQGPGLARKHIRDDHHGGPGTPTRASLTLLVPASAPSQPGPPCFSQ